MALRWNRIDWTPDMLAALQELRAAGHPILLCAERIGVDYKTAVRKCRQLGLAGRLNYGPISGLRLRTAAHDPTRQVHDQKSFY
jgi:hypothetical protein